MFDDNELPDLEVFFPETEPIFTNKNGLKFYNFCDYGEMRVEVGDIVKIRLESSGRDGKELTTDAFGQVLALYEDADSDVSVEVRWLEVEDNLPILRKKRKLGIRSNELFETENVDDVPVGSILSLVHLISDADDVGFDTISDEQERNTYLCRFFVKGKSLYSVTPKFIMERGRQYSEYNAAYSGHGDTGNDNNGLSGNGVGRDSSNRRKFTVDSMREVDIDTGLIATHSNSSSSSGVDRGVGKCGSISPTGNVSSADVESELSWHEKHTLAMRRLHLSVLPKKLPCREEETKNIMEVIRESVIQGRQQFPYYISGMPGTGKTATVLSCIDSLEDEVAQGELPAFEFLEINCLRLHTPSDAYVQLWKHLCPPGQKSDINASEAGKKLVAYFDQAQNTVLSTDPELQARKMTILLIDEIDYLRSSGSQAGLVMSHFTNWPLKANSKIFVIGISNTIALLEQQDNENRNQSRQQIGHNRRQVFKPYSFDQMNEILHSRLLEFASSIIDDKSIEFVARKAAQAGGDVRRALRICQRVIEMIRDKTIKKKVTGGGVPFIHEINAACAEYSENPIISTVKSSCDLDKAILCVFFLYISNSSGVDEMSKSLNGYELYLRLGRLITDIETRQKSAVVREKMTHSSRELIQLLFPPWNIFRTAIDRLMSNGLCKKMHNSAHALISCKEDYNGNCLLQSTLIHCVVDIADIKSALAQSNFIVYIDPQCDR